MATPRTQNARDRKRKRIRAKISGTAERPRLSIFKSNKSLYAQVIDDISGKTIASARGADAGKVGAEVAKATLAKGVKAVVFDRGGFIYTGSVKTLAEAAREGGLAF